MQNTTLLRACAFLWCAVSAFLSSYAVASERGLSVDDSGAPPGTPAPHIAPPGGVSVPRPLVTNRTPVTGVAPLPDVVPQREVQPGEETPQVEEQTLGVGGLRPPRGGLAKDGGTGGSDSGGSGGSSGGGSGGGQGGGGDDEGAGGIDTLIVERRTVPGADAPGIAQEGIPGAPSVPGPISSNNRTIGGGGVSETEDDLWVGRKRPQGQIGMPDSPALGKALGDQSLRPSDQIGAGNTPGASRLTRSGDGGALKETEDDLYVGNKSKRDARAMYVPLSAPAAKQPPRRNCGTQWTNWGSDPTVGNPCPAGCEPAGEPLVRSHQAGKDELIKYALRYQCFYSEATQASKAARLVTAEQETTAGTVAPERGPWGATMRLKGARFGSAEYAHVSGYPDDDATHEPLLRLNAKLGDSLSPDEVEITLPEDPAKSGASSKFGGGVLRIYLSLSNTRQATLAGRYQVGSGLVAATRAGSDTGGVSLLGGGRQGETATTQTGVDAVPRQFGNAAAGEREVSMRNLVSGPSLVAVQAEDAVTAYVIWRPLPGASNYQVHATAKGFNHTATGPQVRQPTLDGANRPGLPSSMNFLLSGLAPGIEHHVWVTVQYPDGRSGASELRTVTTSGPQNPTGFRAFPVVRPQIPGSVLLEWQGRLGAIHYFVEGSNLPRTQTPDTRFFVPDIRTVGRHEWTVVAVYPGGIFNYRDVPRASVICALRLSDQRVVCSSDRNR